MSGKPGGYVGQDFGELSRAAVLESGHAGGEPLCKTAVGWQQAAPASNPGYGSYYGPLFLALLTRTHAKEVRNAG
jgi:hypothetical protein